MNHGSSSQIEYYARIPLTLIVLCLVGLCCILSASLVVFLVRLALP